MRCACGKLELGPMVSRPNTGSPVSIKDVKRLNPDVKWVNHGATKCDEYVAMSGGY